MTLLIGLSFSQEAFAGMPPPTPIILSPTPNSQVSSPSFDMVVTVPGLPNCNDIRVEFKLINPSTGDTHTIFRDSMVSCIWTQGFSPDRLRALINLVPTGTFALEVTAEDENNGMRTSTTNGGLTVAPPPDPIVVLPQPNTAQSSPLFPVEVMVPTDQCVGFIRVDYTFTNTRTGDSFTSSGNLLGNPCTQKRSFSPQTLVNNINLDSNIDNFDLKVTARDVNSLLSSSTTIMGLTIAPPPDPIVILPLPNTVQDPVSFPVEVSVVTDECRFIIRLDYTFTNTRTGDSFTSSGNQPNSDCINKRNFNSLTIINNINLDTSIDKFNMEVTARDRNSLATSSTTVGGLTFTADADLEISKKADVTEIEPGKSFSYTVMVLNNKGPASAQDVMLDDNLGPMMTITGVSPAGLNCTETATTLRDCDLGKIIKGESKSVTLTVMVDSDAMDGTVLMNNALVSSSDDPNDGNNLAQAMEPIVKVPTPPPPPPPPPLLADLKITKKASTAAVAPDDAFFYTITVLNDGPNDAVDVLLNDDVSALMKIKSVSGGGVCTISPSELSVNCNLGTLTKGASKVIGLIIQVDPGVSLGTVLINTASVSSSTPEKDPMDNSVTINEPVVGEGDLILHEIHAVQPVEGTETLVKGKLTVIKAEIENTFSVDQTVMVKIELEGLPAFTEEITIPKSCKKSYYFPNPEDQSLCQTSTTISDLEAPPPADLANELMVIIDPDNEIKELIEGNNDKGKFYEIVKTGNYKIIFKPINVAMDTPIDLKKYQSYSTSSANLIEKTYPIDEDKFTSIIQSAVLTFDNKGKPLSSKSFAQIIDLLKKEANKNMADMVVGIVRTGWFSTLPDSSTAIGRAPYDGTQRIPAGIASIAIGKSGTILDDVAAHETGHTYGWVSKGVDTTRHLLTEVKGAYDHRSGASFDTVGYMKSQVLLDKLPGWISKQTFDFLANELDDESNDPEIIQVSGFVETDGSVELFTWYRSLGELDLPLNNPGEFSIVYLDEVDQVIGETGFDPSPTDTDFELGTGIEIFAFNILDLPEAKKILVQKEGKVLGQKIISTNSPEVTVISPNGGEIFRLGQPIPISWESSDIDGDNLFHDIYLSFDGGESFTILASELDAQDFVFQSESDQTSNSVLVNVVVSDGINTGEDESDAPFSILSQVIGGELIPLDKTSLLVVGAQMNAAWMIPVIVSGIGIGIVIARKF